MSKPLYGGQAVIEGVMIRGPRFVAVAVRDPSGRVVIHGEPITGKVFQSRWARIPFTRGAVVLWDTLVLGMQTLMFSADVAMGGEAEKKAIADSAVGSSGAVWGSVVVAAALAIGVFFVLPVLLASALHHWVSSPILNNLVEKGFRLALVLGYIAGIGRLPDVKRVFGYHGAEHKTVNAYEAGVELTVANVRPFGLIHPRCGTTFLIVVVVVSFFVFAIFGTPPLLIRVLSRIVLIPVVAGIAYEIIRIGATYYHVRWVRALFSPGFAVQRMTTREPDDSMLEVAIAAMQTVLSEEKQLAPNTRIPATPQRG